MVSLTFSKTLANWYLSAFFAVLRGIRLEYIKMLGRFISRIIIII